MGMRNGMADESGGEIVEFAISFPIFIVLAVAVVQLCLLGFQALALEQQVTNATWSVTASEMLSSKDAAGAFKQAVCEGTVLKAENMTVSNMKVEAVDRSSTSKLPDASKNKELGLTQYSHERALCKVECDVTYRLADIVAVPGLSDIEVTRHVQRTLVDTDQIEVS